MWPFNRKKKQSTEDQPVVDEVKEYYQTERRARVGIAWLLGLATLAVTILLAIGIYFGGRWAYRAIFDDDKEDTSTTQEETQTNNSATEEAVEAPEGSSEQAPDNGEDAETPAPASDSTSESTPSTTPRTGPSPELPETGPSEPEL